MSPLCWTRGMLNSAEMAAPARSLRNVGCTCISNIPVQSLDRGACAVHSVVARTISSPAIVHAAVSPCLGTMPQWSWQLEEVTHVVCKGGAAFAPKVEHVAAVICPEVKPLARVRSPHGSVRGRSAT